MSHHNLNPSLQQVSAEVYTAQIAMSWHKGIYIYYKECVAYQHNNNISNREEKRD